MSQDDGGEERFSPSRCVGINFANKGAKNGDSHRSELGRGAIDQVRAEQENKFGWDKRLAVAQCGTGIPAWALTTDKNVRATLKMPMLRVSPDEAFLWLLLCLSINFRPTQCFLAFDNLFWLSLVKLADRCAVRGAAAGAGFAPLC